jgi:DNA helicase II / ATP-dependent DNA helicase PcrA
VIDPEGILEGLNEAQRTAVTTVSGPLAIVAGAGTGKTRVVSHRTAYAVATGVVAPRQVLLVTFTSKAAMEMAERVQHLGVSGVTARTFHSAALAQLRTFWPTCFPGRDQPEVMADTWRLVAPLARGLPGGYRFTQTRDLLDEIAWAKAQGLGPDDYAAADHQPPIPAELFVRLYRTYETIKRRRGIIDFDDILQLTKTMLETEPEVARQVRARYSWFTVDEFQDTTPMQYRLLELWLGDRQDICVVGDDDQTIYSFAGATPSHLREFADRHPGTRVIPIVENYRSSPEILDLANRLLAGTGRQKRLLATHPSGPRPALRELDDDEAEIRYVTGGIGELLGSGMPAGQIAILVRVNAQLPAFEAALAREGIPYTTVGTPFFERPEIRGAVERLRRLPRDLRGRELVAAVQADWREHLGLDAAAAAGAREARERQAALETLLGLLRETAVPTARAGARGLAAGGAGGLDEVLADLARRMAQESSAGDQGVQLMTLHRAKGLEWEAVFLPALEEGLMPVSQAADDPEAIEEERRLLYVGITRARRRLFLSWASRRESPTTGRSQRRRRSRFLASLAPPRPGPRTMHPSGRPSPELPGLTVGAPAPRRPGDDDLVAALKAWRTQRARDDRVPPYVVLHDATLSAIAAQRPGSPSGLAGIKGMGPIKCDRYGLEILAIIVAEARRDGPAA